MKGISSRGSLVWGRRRLLDGKKGRLNKRIDQDVDIPVIQKPKEEVGAITRRYRPRVETKFILIMNSKGGSGKTTVSTNVATMLAAQSANNKVVLVDHDPQGSSKKWTKSRSGRLRKIDSVFPARDNLVKFKRTWRLQIEKDATHVIVDSPAGLGHFELSDRIRESHLMIIPVMPSSIDIAATADFVSKIFVNPAYMNSNKRIAVVANGVNKDMHNFEKLERFLFSLKIPFISVFNDHRSYVLAAERGCGVNELTNYDKDFHDLPEWEKLISWIETEKDKKAP